MGPWLLVISSHVFGILSLCLRPSVSSAARLSATKPPSFAAAIFQVEPGLAGSSAVNDDVR